MEIHSANRAVEGTDENSALNSTAPPDGEESMPNARENSAFHSSSVGGSEPGYELKAISIAFTLLVVPTWFIANLLNEEPTLNLFDFDPPDMMFLIESNQESGSMPQEKQNNLLDTRLTQKQRLLDLYE